MDTVTDVFAFAAAESDYWTEFLSGQDYSDVLSADEVKALEAARTHIEEGVYGLLLLCGRKLAEKLKDDGVVARDYQRGATTKNRSVRVDVPTPLQDKLYGFEFSLSPNEKGEQVELFASLVVKKKVLDQVTQKLATQKTTFKVENSYVYAPGIPLKKDDRFGTLADAASTAMVGLLAGAK